MFKLSRGMLAIGTTIVAATFVAALFLVNGTASATNGRAIQSQAERQAASEYRKAHARCHLETGAGRRACVVDAHVNEERARTVAVTTRGAQGNQLLPRTDRTPDAVDHDGIILEPACAAAAGYGQASCQIQIGLKRNNQTVG